MRWESIATRIAPIAAPALAVAVVFALYGRNLDDYFLGDDFDLILSIYQKPSLYFAKLLFSIESGDAWKSLGFDPALGHGYLRPVKIWLLKLDLTVWKTWAPGYHATATLLFAGVVVCVYAILLKLVDGARLPALLGALGVAAHPVAAGIVPFITAREETLSVLLMLLCLVAFLRHRLDGKSLVPFYLFYTLALFSKESSIAAFGLAAGYDLAHGRIRLNDRESLREQVRLYAPIAAILVVYFGLRWIAFGNFSGGSGLSESRFSSPTAYLEFHGRFLRFLVGEPMLDSHGIPGLWLVPATLLGLGVAFVVVRRRQLDRAYFSNLFFAGPLFYLCSTAILYGSYFTPRHNFMPVIGAILFSAIVFAGFARLVAPRWSYGAAAAITLLGAWIFVPPTLADSRRFENASELVQTIVRRIDRSTSDLPDGCTILLEQIPQSDSPPYFFGWGLLSALQQPFSRHDLANRCVVVNYQHIDMLDLDMEIPEHFDRVIRVPLSAQVQGR